MGLANFVPLGSLAALLAGVLLFVSQLLNGMPLNLLPFLLSGDELSIYGFMGINGYLGVLLAVLLQLGLIGLYVPQAKTIGILGGAGFLLAFVGIRLGVGPSFIDPILIKPSEWPLGGMPSGFWSGMVTFWLTFVLGWALFGIAVLRTSFYPWLPTALLVVGTLVFALPFAFSGIVFAAALAWIGYFLFARSSTTRIEAPVQWGGGGSLVRRAAPYLPTRSSLPRLLEPGCSSGHCPY
jgi:hypothetical protein